MRKFLIIFFILLTGCGYESIYIEKNINDFEFKNITLIGDRNINKKISSVLNFKEDKKKNNLNEIIIKSNKNIFETSKNNKGQIETYKTSITLNLIIKKNDNIVKKKQFIEDFSYNNKDNKFDLNIYQKEVENNITNKIIEEIIIYLSL